jgi:hypothetical protein
MRFTTTDLISIEQTMEKLYAMASAVLPHESTDMANVRALLFITGELRASAKLTDSADREVRVAGFDRLDRLLVKA